MITYVDQPVPIDLTGIKDSGVKALVMLAYSLEWSINQKPGRPLTLTSLDGMQKRLPTDSSIRISIFQQCLSTIMTHTDPELIPTIELMDDIIAKTKPSTDHQRRLRLAVGETPQQHRERVENMDTEPKGAREPQPLTTRIELPEETAANEALIEYINVTNPDHEAADGEDHGELLTREPTRAKRSGSGSKHQWYQSDTSFERHWTDGYIDFECMVCGKAYTTSRGVGGHSQIHMDTKMEVPAWKRATVTGEEEREPEPTIEWEEPDPGQTATVPIEEPEKYPALKARAEKDAAQETLTKIINLVVPAIVRDRDNLRHLLDEARHEVAELRAENEKLTRDWAALKDMLSGR